MDEDELTKELEEMEGTLVDESVLEAPVVPEKAEIASQAKSNRVNTASQSLDRVAHHCWMCIFVVCSEPVVAAAAARPAVAVAPVSAASASSSSSAARPEHLDANEAKELEQLEALMNA
jgi:hypothetical protein